MGEIKSRKYCCSNWLRIEAMSAAIFDTILSFFALIAISAFYLIFDESWLPKEEENDMMLGFEDLRRFSKLDVETRELSILIITTLIALHIFMNSLLLAGIYKRNSIMIRVWFVCAITTFVIALAMFFGFIYITRDKILNSAVFGFYILFYLYFLWVVRLFLKELVTVSYASQEQLAQDDGCSRSGSVSEKSIEEGPPKPDGQPEATAEAGADEDDGDHADVDGASTDSKSKKY